MSKNPYFAHLPTWRNRQDLAYAIDNLPTILEALTASSPLLATYSYPSTTSSRSPPSSSSSHSHSSASGSLSPLPSSSYSSTATITSSAATPSSSATTTATAPYSSPSSSASSSTSSYASPSSTPSTAGSSSPAKSKASAFKERFVLDLAKECHRSLSKSSSPSPSTATTANTPTATFTPNTTASTPSRRFIGSVQQQQQYQDQTNKNIVSSYYPLQFSTRARAMAYLIEILQSLQKEHCGCDLVKGCYCGQDGIEDHEGKSPCYVCGEWYPDRPDLMRTGGGGGGGHEGDMDSTRRQQGKSWHEQGSLRHHVAEAKVKKWLDSVWKPPLAPATTPEQENVKQFGLRSQEDLRQCFDHPHYQHRQQQQQQQQQHSARMEPGRPWSVHDVEIEARSKSCSRNNSASSNHSMSFVASPSAQYPSATTSPYSSAASPQQDLSGSAYGYGSSSGQWHFTTSPATAASSPSDSPLSKPVRATPPSQRAGRILWAPPSEAYGFSSLHADSQGYSQARVRTMSRSDTPPPSGNSVNYLGSPISSMRPSTPPVMRSSSYHTNHVSNTASNNNSSGNSIDRNGRSKPVRASTTNSTFSIPQEILNPNYRSPTFRIKSWSPAPSSSSPSGASPSSAFSPFTPRLSFSKDSSSSPGDSQPGKKQTLDGWTGAGAKVETKPLLSTPSSISSAQESVLKSSKMGRSDQEDCCMVLSPPPEASGQQGNTRENPTSRAPASAPTPASRSPVAGAGLGAGAVGVGAIEGEEVKKNAPFQFNFTSSRFRAAVQAKASMDSLKSAAGVHGRVGGGGVQSDSVQKSAAVLNEEVLRVQSGSTTMTVTDNGSHKEDQRVKSKATTSGTAIPIPVAVVIVTEEIVLSETDMDLQEPAPTPAPTSATAFLPSKAPPTSTGLTSSRSTNSIQNSAPLSSPTPLASSEPTPFSSLSSSSASTSTSTSALTSASSSNCSLGPKSPNKNNCPSNGAGDVQRATSWSSFHMLMQTMTVTAATTLTAATAVPPQCGGVLLHVDASPSSS